MKETFKFTIVFTAELAWTLIVAIANFIAVALPLIALAKLAENY